VQKLYAFFIKNAGYQTNVPFFALVRAEICIMKNFILRYKSAILGSLIGAAAGFLYWKFVGCQSGTCAITSSPVNSAAYGAIMGVLVSDLFKPKTKTHQ